MKTTTVHKMAPGYYMGVYRGIEFEVSRVAANTGLWVGGWGVFIDADQFDQYAYTTTKTKREGIAAAISAIDHTLDR